MRFTRPPWAIVVLCCLPLALSAQETGIRLHTADASPGYTLFQAWAGAPGIFLIDNCGDLVHQWTGLGSANLTVKLLPDGYLLYAEDNTIFERDWEGEIVNQVSLTEPDLSLQYEQLKLPNGNYLSVGRRAYSQDQFIELGYDLSQSGPSQVDVVLELDATSGAVVWEWNIADHVIQERDSTLGNYGVVADHPELFNMDAIGRFDWNFTESFMINGLDYHPELQQIMLSVRKMSEIVIIEHTSTTAEAAGHTGGIYGKGGDILYRWGNPANYNRGQSSDRMLYYQHNPNWITSGPDSGKVAIFNNGLNRPDVTFETRCSDMPIISTPVDVNGNYTLEAGEAFGPTAPDLLISGEPDSSRFYSGYLSGATVLPSGNAFVTVGLNGRLLEFNRDGQLVWEYGLPNNGSIFRAERYPIDYPAFAGRSLSPLGPVPGTNSTYACELVSATNDPPSEGASAFKVQYSPDQRIRILSEQGPGFVYQLIDQLGRPIVQRKSANDVAIIDTMHLFLGFYVVIIEAEGLRRAGSFKVVVY